MGAGGLAEAEWIATEDQLTGAWAGKGERKATRLAELCLMGLAEGGRGASRLVSAI